MATIPDDPPIDGTFKVEASRPLHGAGGGLAAFVALNRRGGDSLMAVRVPDGQSPRPQPLTALAKIEIPFCLQPVARGVARDDRGRMAQFVICAAPPGPPLVAATPAEGDTKRDPWSEAELIDTLVRPVAAALAALAARHVTHRAIRAEQSVPVRAWSAGDLGMRLGLRSCRLAARNLRAAVLRGVPSGLPRRRAGR